MKLGNRLKPLIYIYIYIGLYQLVQRLASQDTCLVWLTKGVQINRNFSAFNTIHITFDYSVYKTCIIIRICNNHVIMCPNIMPQLISTTN